LVRVAVDNPTLLKSASCRVESILHTIRAQGKVFGKGSECP